MSQSNPLPNPLNVPADWLQPVTLRLSGQCPGYARSHVQVRGHSVTIDEPPERGGGDQGPAPTELMLAALVGVSNVILRRLARRDGVAVHSVAIDLAADMDRRGVWLAEPVGNPWRRIVTTLQVASEASEIQWLGWQRDLPLFSPLHATLRAAGTVMVEEWRRVAA